MKCAGSVRCMALKRGVMAYGLMSINIMMMIAYWIDFAVMAKTDAIVSRMMMITRQATDD